MRKHDQAGRQGNKGVKEGRREGEQKKFRRKDIESRGCGRKGGGREGGGDKKNEC